MLPATSATADRPTAVTLAAAPAPVLRPAAGVLPVTALTRVGSPSICRSAWSSSHGR
jgi:hypothetical protein